MQRLQNPLVAATLLSCAVAAQAQPRPAVIELFTSEGCSSCPPAETYLGELAQRPDVLALAFHVDYWDDLGWRDRFEVTEATPRQRLYAKALRLPSIYTPQLIVDGRADFVGSNRAAISEALAEPRHGVAVAFAMHDGDIQIDVGAQDGGGPCDVLLVAYLHSATSPIGRGENAGRTLTEFNIVRSIQNLGPWNGQPRQYHAPLKRLPSDATDVAVLVQSAGQGSVVGAATHALR